MRAAVISIDNLKIKLKSAVASAIEIVSFKDGIIIRRSPVQVRLSLPFPFLKYLIKSNTLPANINTVLGLCIKCYLGLFRPALACGDAQVMHAFGPLGRSQFDFKNNSRNTFIHSNINF